uniref:L1 cell adhesion molecule n=1 Tax=Eptatretus burgeri TaxID=7764 RepID=A0A8C4NH49_EPTBU
MKEPCRLPLLTICFVITLTKTSCLLFLCTHASGTTPPTITEQSPKDYILDPRDDIVIRCEGKGSPPPRFYWTKDGKDFRTESDPRIMIRDNSGTLRIRTPSGKRAQVYEGVYQCFASNVVGTALSQRITLRLSSTFLYIPLPFDAAGVLTRTYWSSSPILLLLLSSDSPLGNRAPTFLSPRGTRSNVMALRGSVLELECIAEGLPTPHIQWFKEGGEIPWSRAEIRNFNKTLRIANVTEADEGVMMCQASNFLSTAQHFTTVTVEAAPYWLVNPPQSQLVEPGQSTSIVCRVGGRPTSQIRWMRNGTPVEGTLIFLSQDVDRDTIEFHDLPEGSTGVYQCVASNRHGSLLANAFINVLVFLLLYVFGKSLSHAVSDTYPDAPRFVTEGHTLTVWNVTKDDQGTYQCNVSTELDHILAQASLSVYGDKFLIFILSLFHFLPVFVVEYEENMYEPRVWRKLNTVPGNVTSTELLLRPYINYCFRVKAVNEAGTGEPSWPSERLQTKATVPDRNPSEVKGEGSAPDNVVITWKPVHYLRRNGPDFGYRVFWHPFEVEEEDDAKWNMTFVTHPVFIIRKTTPFTPYRIAVQAVNSRGSAPEPEIIVGYSGEDVPLDAPDDVQVEVMNSTLVEVTWELVNTLSIRGHLKGYKVIYNRVEIQTKQNESPNIMSFPGPVTQGLLPNLRPYSVYSFTVHVYNGKYDGPPSITQLFRTPEGVPGPPEELQVVHESHDVVRVKWSPPLQHNGILIGYKLRYQLGEFVFFLCVCVSVCLSLLLCSSLSLLFCLKLWTQRRVWTHRHICPVIDIPQQTWFIGVMCAVALLILLLLVVCFIRRNRGGKYPVKEKENAHPDPESQPMKEETYSDDKKPFGGSRPSLDTDVQRGMSEDSLDEYGDHSQGLFNEDGSFIGQYGGRKEREGMESSTATSPMNPTNGPISFVFFNSFLFFVF